MNDNTLANTLAAIERKLETITIKVSGLPLMAATLNELRDEGRQFRQEVRMMRAAINDMEKVRITTGEVEALHTELDQLADDRIDIKARLTVLESPSQ